MSVPDRVLDVETQDPQGGPKRVAGLETLRDHEQFRRVAPGRIGRRPNDPDRGAEVHVVDEPMLERDVGLEWGRPKLAGLLPVFRRLPRLAKGDAGAGRQAALDLQGHVLKRDDLLVAGERSPQGLRRRDDEEVRLEAGVLDGDALPFTGAAEQLDDGDLRLLGPVHRLAAVRRGDDPNVKRLAHAFATILMTSPSSTGWSRPTTIFVRALIARMKWFPKSV